MKSPVRPPARRWKYTPSTTPTISIAARAHMSPCVGTPQATAAPTIAATQAAARSAADAKARADAEKARADANLRAAREERAKIERE